MAADVLRFNAHGPDGLIDRKPPGAVPKLNSTQRQALAEKVVGGPTRAVDGVVRWRLKNLAHWIFEEFGTSIHQTTVGRELKAMGFRKLSARPRHHAQDVEALEALKKIPDATLARRGTRPVAPQDQRTSSAHIFT